MSPVHNGRMSRRFAAERASLACVAQPGVRDRHLATRRDKDDSQPKICPRPPRIVLIVPTVMLQADRARE